MSEQPAAEQFHAIQTSALQEGRVPPIDLFIQRESDETPILFLSHSMPFNRRTARNLIQSAIKELWIREKDRVAFDRYLKQNLSSIVRDPKIPIHSRCSLTYDLSLDLMKQVYESNDPEQVMKSSQDVLQNIIEVIFADPEAANGFIMLTSKDYHLYTHSINVCLYGMALSRKALDITKEESLRDFGPGLLLHDIGKLLVPPEILNKSGPLTEEEYEKIKEHPQNGLEMVEGFVNVSDDMRTMILHHHERLDGSGYPNKLRGSEISIPARICAIVDTFDAITTNRAFQERKSSFDAFREMKQREVPRRLDDTFFREFVLLFRPGEKNPGTA